MNTGRTDKYVTLIRQFLDREIGADDFERRYLAEFKAERSGLRLREYEPLQELFAAVDAYCPNPSLRSEDDLDEGQLREAAHTAFDALKSDAGHKHATTDTD